MNPSDRIAELQQQLAIAERDLRSAETRGYEQGVAEERARIARYLGVACAQMIAPEMRSGSDRRTSFGRRRGDRRA